MRFRSSFACAALAILACASACSSTPSATGGAPRDSIAVAQTDDTLSLASSGQDGFTLHLSLAALALTVDFQTADGRAMHAEVSVIANQSTSPSATIAVDGATLTTQHTDLGGWQAQWNGHVYDLSGHTENPELASALRSSPMGAILVKLLALHRMVPARIAESEALFQVARLAWTSADGPLPVLLDPDDVHPPGHLPHDVIGLGMSCNKDIKCPSFAPFCIVAEEGDKLGFCTRGCLTDDDCTTEATDATDARVEKCGIAIGDVPNVSRELRGCFAACDRGSSCPGLLSCSPGTNTCWPQSSTAE